MTNFEWWGRRAAAHDQFLCCMCFESFPIEDAWKDGHGHRWDCCVPCARADGWTPDRH